MPIKSQPRHRRSLLLGALTMLAVCGSAMAGWNEEQPSVAKSLAAQPLATPETAAAIARQELGGRVLSVTVPQGGERGYRVRLLLEGGRVTTVLVDPQGDVRTLR